MQQITTVVTSPKSLCTCQVISKERYMLITLDVSDDCYGVRGSKYTGRLLIRSEFATEFATMSMSIESGS